MKTILRHLMILSLALPLLPVAAQTAQGLGQNIRAVTTTPQGIVAITEDAKVLFSTDQWMNFTEIFDLRFETADDFVDLHAIASNGSRVVVGGTDSLLYTADLSVSSSNWTPKTPTSDVLFGDVRGLAASATGTWIAVGDGGILRSGDGMAWLDDLSNSDLFHAVTWVSANTWVAAGADGIWWSTDDGLNWTDTETAGSYTAVASDGTGNVLAVGEMGTLVRSTDNGETFTALTGNGTDYRSVAATGANTWVVGGVDRTLLSLDDQGVLSQASFIGYEEASLDEALGLVVLADGTVLIAGVDAIPAPEIDATDDPSNPVEVTLAQSAGNTMWYTTDGSDPRASATRQDYSEPFTVTGNVTVRSVAELNGIHSAAVQREIQAGEELEPFSITIQVAGGEVVLTQDVATNGYTFGLEYATDLAATPQEWSAENHADQEGTGGELTWTLSPVPATPRFWRVVVIDE